MVWEGERKRRSLLKEAVCRIRVPLGDSTCSCPSRSVCRHLITAVLYLKKELEKSALSCGEEAGTEAEQKAEAGEKAEKQSPGALLPELEQELLSIPAGRLRQACKTRGYREFLLHMDQGRAPETGTRGIGKPSDSSFSMESDGGEAFKPPGAFHLQLPQPGTVRTQGPGSSGVSTAEGDAYAEAVGRRKERSRGMGSGRAFPGHRRHEGGALSPAADRPFPSVSGGGGEHGASGCHQPWGRASGF